jgi:hypothetical protein
MHGRGYSGCHRYLTPRVFLRLSKYPASLPMSGCRPVMIIGQLDRLQTVNTHGAVQKKIWFAVQLALTRHVSERPDPPVSRDGPGRVMTDSTNSKIDTACRLLAGPSINRRSSHVY